MRPSLFLGALVLVSLGAVGCSGSPSSTNVIPAGTTQSNASNSAPAVHPFSARAMPIGQSIALCPPATDVAAGAAACHSMRRTDITPIAAPSVALADLPGLKPGDLARAYGLTSVASAGDGQTVAVVVAYDNPSLAADLAVYRLEFGLPACTVASGCLKTVYGKKVKPGSSAAWAAESDLDVEMVSAICPKCHIVVAEAPSDQIKDLAATVATAVGAGATVVSNSYSVPEDNSVLAYDADYNVPGVPMTAGSGDGGYGVVGFPASSEYVTAVGGTTLETGGTAADTQQVWSYTASGCSSIVAKPSWQTDTGCSMRTENDLAVVADPNSGVATYVSALGGWNIFGGTSVGSPIVASMYALAGNGSTLAGPSNLYGHAGAFRPVAGSSGACSPSYLCNGSTGYNGPAGLGTPYGLSAF